VDEKKDNSDQVVVLAADKAQLEDEVCTLKETNRSLSAELHAAQEECRSSKNMLEEQSKQIRRDANTQLSLHQQLVSVPHPHQLYSHFNIDAAL
jgi:multidrug resistance efflux pump